MADSTTINFTPANSQDSAGVAHRGDVLHLEAYIDTATQNLGAASFALFDVPEGHKHMTTVVEVLTAEGGTCTADLGITGGDVDCLIDGVDLNAAAGTLYAAGAASTAEVHAPTGATFEYITPDGGVTFSLLLNNAMDAGIFRIVSKWFDCRGTLTQQTPNSA
jgi:hypothetical protein